MNKIVLALSLTLSPMTGVLAQNSTVDVAQADRDQGFALASQAYVWGYPLAITAATAIPITATDRPLPNAHAPFNTFGHVAKLFTAADKDVVSSNVDTIYSSAFVDLKQGAALVSVPDVGDRYYALMLEDAYTNIFGYIGSRATGYKAGRYLIKPPGWQGTVPAGVDNVIEAPTSLIWIIGRTLVANQADLPNVHAVQAQYKLEMIPPVIDAKPIKQRWNLTVPDTKVPSQIVEQLDWKNYYQWVGQLMKDNPPPTTDSALYTQFANIGLTVEHGFDPSKLSEATRKGIELGYEAGKRIVKRDAMKSGSKQANGWAYNLEQGKWGQNFNLRAAIAYRSLGQNTAEEALYFNTRVDAKGQQLNGAKRYTITFPKGQQPPVDAFWSITLYNAGNFFVDNPINRYAIGNRTVGLKTNADGSLTVYIQKDAPTGDAKANWLPAPDGEFRLSMRTYNPKPEVLDGSWVPPAVIAAHKG